MTKRACKAPDCNRWGVPDWRDAAAYPKIDSFELVQWWWEFTRRRQDYRELWDKWSPKHLAHVKAMMDDPYYRNNSFELFGSRSLDYQLDSVPTDDVTAVRVKFGMSTILDPRKVFSFAKLNGHRFHRNGLHEHAPSIAMENAMIAYSTGGEGAVQRDISKRKREESLWADAGEVHYTFDLSKPLEPQFEDARQFLAEIQEEEFERVTRRPNRRDNWPLFLRALDAREGSEAPATYQQMARAFWPRADGKTAQSARDIYNSACALRANFPI